MPTLERISRAKQSAVPKPIDTTCRHCGLPANGGDEFCCSGCAFVYCLIHEQGLQRYYDLKDRVTIPADAALQQRAPDFAWLREAQERAERDGGERVMRVAVQGISCIACVWLIDRVFDRQPGAGRIETNAQLGEIQFTWEKTRFDAVAFAVALQRFNYLLGPLSARTEQRTETKPLVKKIGLCTAFGMNVMLFTLPGYFGMSPHSAYAHVFATLALLFATLSLLVGGSYFIEKAVGCLLHKTASIDIPIAVGIIGAYIGSVAGWILGQDRLVYFDFVATFILLMLIGRWAQQEAVEQNRRRLIGRQPVFSTIEIDREDRWSSSAPESLRKGDRYRVGPGQIVPVASLLQDSAFVGDLSWVNGESEHREYVAQQLVPSGAINVTQHSIVFSAAENYKDSLLQVLLESPRPRAATNRLIERIVKGYLIAIFGIAAISGVSWWLVSNDPLRACLVVTAVLVVSCPCAIGLAFPLVEEVATVALRRAGVFVRQGELWSRLGKIEWVAFDKTGTLTLDTPRLINREALFTMSPREKQVLFALVKINPHPVARSLFNALMTDRNRPITEIDNSLDEIVGQGVAIRVEQCEWRLGRSSWALGATTEKAPRVAGVTFARAGHKVADFRFDESMREDAEIEIARLQSRGLQVAILSGDTQEKVERAAELINIPKENAWAQMTPVEKAGWVRARGTDTTMILGDGANDSLAFNEAACRGTPVIHRGILSEKADFYYLGKGIHGVRALFGMNELRRRTQNALLVFSILYNLVAVSIAAAGYMHPLLAAILMPVSSLITLGIVFLGMRNAFRVAMGE